VDYAVCNRCVRVFISYPLNGYHPADIEVFPDGFIADAYFNAIDEDCSVARVKFGAVDKNAAKCRYRSLADNPGAVDPTTREKRTATSREGCQQNGGHQNE
ncbi:MAG: hypothetical protein AB1Z20_09890, partial [Desulfobacterales bacterium]